MANDKISINFLIERLNKPFSSFSSIYRQAMNDDTYILHHYTKDAVEEVQLIRLLRKSVYCHSLRSLVPDILYCICENSITDKVLQYCTRYPGKYRTTLLSQMAHMWLTETQLLVINSIIDTPEAFCKLFIRYAEDPKVTTREFETFLCDNKHKMHQISCPAIISSYKVTISDEKKSVLEKF